MSCIGSGNVLLLYREWKVSLKVGVAGGAGSQVREIR